MTNVMRVAGWVCVGLAFGVWVAVSRDATAAAEYYSAYLLELSLSVDNFVVSDALDELRYLRQGLAAVLVFSGVKMITSEWVHISAGVSVFVIGLLLGVTIAASVWPRRIKR